MFQAARKELRFIRGKVPAALVVLLAASASALSIPIPGVDYPVGVDGYADALAIVGTQGGPRQRPQGLLALRFDAAGPGRSRAHLELRGYVGGPYEGARAGAFDFAHTYQNRSPAVELNEAYIDLYLDHADIRAGVQKIAWGKLDGIPPTDVINPLDYHLPLVQEVEERKIGIPALQASYYFPAVSRLDLDQLRATLVYVPIAVPPRLPLTEERWFPPTTSLRQVTITREQQVQAGVDLGQDLNIPVNLELANRRPPRRFDAGGIGLRIGGTWRESDWDIYHYTGPETRGNASTAAEVVFDSSMPIDRAFEATASLTQAHRTIHMTGVDWASALGKATIRAEGAVFQDRVYLRASRDLLRGALMPETIGGLVPRLLATGRATVPVGDLFVPRDSIEWGVGIDYLVQGFVPLLQVDQIILLDSGPDLTIHNPETRVTASLRRRFLEDRLEVELRGLYALEVGSWFVLPRVSYVVGENLRLRLGYLTIGGPRTTLLGQYKENDQVVFQARYTF